MNGWVDVPVGYVCMSMYECGVWVCMCTCVCEREHVTLWDTL